MWETGNGAREFTEPVDDATMTWAPLPLSRPRPRPRPRPCRLPFFLEEESPRRRADRLSGRGLMGAATESACRAESGWTLGPRWSNPECDAVLFGTDETLSSSSSVFSRGSAAPMGSF